MAIPLIGSLLGLGLQGVSLAANQIQGAQTRQRLAAQPSMVRQQQREANKQALAQASSISTHNPLQAIRQAQQASQDAAGRASAQAMNEKIRQNQIIAGLERQDSARLAQGLSGLGAGLAAGAAQLATTPGKTPTEGSFGPAATGEKQDPSKMGGGALMQLLGGQSPFDTTAPQAAAPEMGTGLATPPTQAGPTGGPLTGPPSQGNLVSGGAQVQPVQQGTQPQPAAFTPGASLQPTGPFGQPITQEELLEQERQRILSSVTSAFRQGGF